MSQQEQTRERDLTYSQWHRKESLGRYIGRNIAHCMGMIDGDAIEYREETKEPLALLELTAGSAFKPVTVLRNLAKMAKLPCLMVRYVVSDEVNPRSPLGCLDIKSFHVRREWPPPKQAIAVVSPYSYAKFLENLRLVSFDEAWKVLLKNPTEWAEPDYSDWW